MALFGKNKLVESKFYQLHQLLKSSFFNVRNDTNNIFKWLNYLYQKSLDQEQHIREQSRNIIELKTELSLVPKTKEQLKQIIDEFYSYEAMIKRIEDIESRFNSLSRAQIPAVRGDDYEFLEIQKRLEKLEQKKAGLKEKLIKKITKKSKDYLKTIVLSYIKKYERISALQLREMIIDEQGLCSKSSFYRILEEIEEQEEIGVIKKGKEKEYFAKISEKLTKK